jgi:hypothetical protein
MPVWNLLFSSTLDLGLKGLLASGFVQKAMHAFINKNAHPCQENFTRRFGSGRFSGIVFAGKDARERREALAAIVFNFLLAGILFTNTLCFYVQVPENMFFSISQIVVAIKRAEGAMIFNPLPMAAATRPCAPAHL